jgi:type I restriction enzyme S subunit
MTQLPNSWQLLTLGDVAHWTSGGTPSSKNSDYYNGDIPWVCIGDLNEGSVLETAKRITKAGLDSSSAKVMPKGTIMLAMYATSIGDTGIMETSMATNQAIACGVPNSEIIAGKYLLYYLQSQKHEFFAAGRGGAQPNINQGIVKGWPIPVPSIDEQNKIVELLEDHLSRLDAALVDVKQAKSKAAQFRRSLLQAAFTGNLGFGGTSFMTELPSEWRSVTLDEAMSECRNGLTYRNNPELAGFPVSRIETISKGEIDFEKVGYGGVALEGNQKHLLKPGDILFSHINSMLHVGKVAIYKSGMPALLHGMNLLRITPSDDFVPEFFFYLFQSSDVRKQIWSKAKHAVNQASINIGELKTVVIPKPPKDEQYKIVELLEDHLSRLDVSVSVADGIEKQSNGLRRSLLQAAFTGQLTKEVVSV